jgi:surfeit locus 1 family protein
MNSTMSRGRLAFLMIAVLASFVFVRLGFWQLDRHAEARERNAARDAQLAASPVPLETLLAGDGERLSAGDLEWRRVRLAGRWDFTGEVLVRNRMHGGRPGVHVVTPFRTGPDTDGATVLVLRGWLPAPDAMNPGPIPGAPAPAGRAAALVGVIRPSREGAGLPMLPAGEGARARQSFAAIDVAAIEGETADTAAYAPFFVQLLPMEGGANAATEGPLPVPLPEPGNGPHLAYAVQWFAFALITLVGAVAYVSSRRPTGGPRSSLQRTAR